VQHLLAVIRSSDFTDAVNRLPGYVADDAGSVVTLEQAFPSFARPAPHQR